MARAKNGRFTKGCSPGPGRPPRATETAYLAALSDAVSASDWRKIVLKAKADAIEGDPKARDWLAKYLLGSHCGTLADLAANEAEVEKQSSDSVESERPKLRYKIHHESPERIA